MKTRTWVAVSAALAGVIATGPATAQSMEQLKAQMEAMQQQMEVLKAQMQEMAKQQEMAREEAAEEKVAAAAPAPVAKSGNSKVELKVSGQVNRALLAYDDGDETEVRHVDNDNSSTRVRFDGKAELTDDLSVGTRIEVQFESNSSADVNQLDNKAVSTNSFTERKLEFWLDSKTLGKISVGQGDTASNGTSEVNLSGTDVVGYSAIGDTAGGLTFVDKSTNTPSGPAIGDVFANFDGLSRDDRLRYDTPTFGGFGAAASAVDGGEWDLAGRYSRKFGPAKVAAAISHSNAQATDDISNVNGSASVLLDNGLNLTFAAGERDVQGRDDPMFWYGKLGWQFKSLTWGSTALAIEYGESDDVAAAGDEATVYGAMVVQEIDRAAMELYLGLRNHELDRPGASFDDILTVMAGARVKF